MPARRRALAPKKAAPRKVGRAVPAKVSTKVSAKKKEEGDGPVFAYFARLPAEQQAIASKLDAIVVKNVPGVKRAMKWNVPFYGQAGKGWLCAFAAFKKHCSVNFFLGAKLRPVPPDGGVKENRRVAYETLADVDEVQLASWVRQAAAIPGWLAPPARGGP